MSQNIKSSSAAFLLGSTARKENITTLFMNWPVVILQKWQKQVEYP